MSFLRRIIHLKCRIGLHSIYVGSFPGAWSSKCLICGKDTSK